MTDTNTPTLTPQEQKDEELIQAAFQFGCRFLVHRTAFERDAHISAGAVANVFGVDRIARASDDTGFTQARNALMDGCAADTAYFCHVFEGYAGVKRDYLKYLQIQFINFLHVLFF